MMEKSWQKSKKSAKFFCDFAICLFPSVVLFFLSHPNFIFVRGLSFCAFFEFAPVFIFCAKNNPKKCFVFGFLWAIFGYALFGYYLFRFEKFFFFVLLFWFSIFYGIVFALFSKIRFFWIKVLVFCAFEFFRTKGYFGFSYGCAVYSLWQILPLVKCASIFGIWSLEALVVFCSAILAECFLRKFSKKTLIFLAIYVFFLAGFFCVGKILLKIDSKNENPKKINVILIQNNEDPHKNSVESFEHDIFSLMALTDSALSKNPNADLVVWSETAVVPSILLNYSYKIDEQRQKIVKTLLEWLNSKSENLFFAIGNGDSHLEKDEKTGKLKILDYNAVLFFQGGKNCIPPTPDFYYKTHLVPLSEHLPRFLEFLRPFLKKIGAHFWERGKEIKIFNADWGNFSAPICFEDTFPSICRAMKKNGAQFFVVLLNDSWMKSKAAQNQHLAMAVFRSAENRVPQIRASASGVTCAIDKNGKIFAQLPNFKKDFLTVTLEF